MVYGGKVAAGTTDAVQNGNLIPARPALVGTVEPAKITLLARDWQPAYAIAKSPFLHRRQSPLPQTAWASYVSHAQ